MQNLHMTFFVCFSHKVMESLIMRVLFKYSPLNICFLKSCHIGHIRCSYLPKKKIYILQKWQCPLYVRSKVCMAPFHVRSKVGTAPIHVRHKWEDFAPHVVGSHADFSPYMERRHCFKDQKRLNLTMSKYEQICFRFGFPKHGEVLKKSPDYTGFIKYICRMYSLDICTHKH